MKKINNWLFLLAGLFLVAFGVGFIVKADMGVLPTTCLPIVLSNVIGITIGKAVILFQGILIIAQIIVMRGEYNIIQLLQVPIGFGFGYLTDFALFVLQGIGNLSYLEKWVWFLVGVVISAIGVSMEVVAGVGTLATEGFVLAVSKKIPISFGTLKAVFDILLVLISMVISLLLAHRIIGIREGTVFSAVLLGMISKYFINIIQKYWHIYEQRK